MAKGDQPEVKMNYRSAPIRLPIVETKHFNQEPLDIDTTKSNQYQLLQQRAHEHVTANSPLPEGMSFAVNPEVMTTNAPNLIKVPRPWGNDIGINGNSHRAEKISRTSNMLVSSPLERWKQEFSREYPWHPLMFLPTSSQAMDISSEEAIEESWSTEAVAGSTLADFDLNKH